MKEKSKISAAVNNSRSIASFEKSGIGNAAATPKVDAKPKDPKHLKEILESGDYCAFDKAMHDKQTRADYEIVTEFIFGPKRENLGDENEGWILECYFTWCRGSFSEAVGPMSDVVSKFYTALYWGGLLSETDEEERDFQKADEILTELENKYPQNGAFPFYLAAIKEKIHAPKNQIEEQLRLALQSSEFNDYRMEIEQEIYSRTAVKSLIASTAYDMARQSHAILFSPTLKLMEGFVKDNPDFQDPMLKLGERLARDFINETDLDYKIDWLMRKYNIGQNIYEKAWKLKFPNTPLPMKYITLSQFFDQIKEKAEKEIKASGKPAEVHDRNKCYLEENQKFFDRRVRAFLSKRAKIQTL